MTESDNTNTPDVNPYDAPLAETRDEDAEHVSDALRRRRWVVVLLGVVLVPIASAIAFVVCCVGTTMVTMKDLYNIDPTLGVIAGGAAALGVGYWLTHLCIRQYNKRPS